MKLIPLAIAAVILAVGATGYAYDHGTTTTIKNIVVLHDGAFYLELNHEVCSTAKNKRIAYSYNGVAVNGRVPTEEGRDRMLRAAISAKLAGSAVRVYTDDPPSSVWGCYLGGIMLAQ